MRLLVVALLVAACHRGSTSPEPKAPTGPSASVKTEVDAAEKAELARKHDVARAHYEAAIVAAHDPPSLDFAHHKFASTLITWGELAEARGHLEAAVAATADDAAAWHDLGLVRHTLGDNANALVALDRARALRPNDPRPRIAIAALKWKTGDRAGAKAEYTALLELDLPDAVRDKVKWALDVLARNGAPAN